jgi:hypothetical protein
MRDIRRLKFKSWRASNHLVYPWPLCSIAFEEPHKIFPFSESRRTELQKIIEKKRRRYKMFPTDMLSSIKKKVRHRFCLRGVTIGKTGIKTEVLPKQTLRIYWAERSDHFMLGSVSLCLPEINLWLRPCVSFIF